MKTLRLSIQLQFLSPVVLLVLCLLMPSAVRGQCPDASAVNFLKIAA